jgi:Family of unknown function (DUF6062)
MPDAQTIFELRLACHKPGCPICTLIQRAGARYIEGIFNESILDPGIRQKLADSQGFCYDHTWQSISLKLSDALGHAILYQDLVRNTLQMIADTGGKDGIRIVNALSPTLTCPACRIEEVTLERVIDALIPALRDQDFIAEFKQSNGFCLPHLKRILPDLDGKRRGVVLLHQSACLEELKAELAEFIRKSDYRFRDESIGKEGDAYKRAADMIKGKHRLAEKKDFQ